jgi:carboxyl-terminal processing protease
MAICATYAPFPFEDGERWVFQDVHEGGPAARAGIRPGDILLSVADRSFRPPEHPHFPMKASVPIEVLTREMRHVRGTLEIPAPKARYKQLPYVESKPDVSHRRLNLDTGYIRVARYPGDIGVEVANEMSAAVKNLKPITRLIVDLRGNSGGGIGVLRLMSLLTEQRLVAGKFTKGGIVHTSDIDRHAFLLNRIPTRKWELYPLGVRYFSAVVADWLAKRKHQVTVMTEGLDSQPFHGRVVLLIDRHTASANEILLAFAQEHELATIVGEPSPGRMLGGEKFKLLYDYWLVIPRGSFRTAIGSEIEGRPIVPDVSSPFDPELARLGRDPQLEKAIEVVARL